MPSGKEISLKIFQAPSLPSKIFLQLLNLKTPYGIQKIDRGESFTLNVMARDFPDDNWTITSAVEPREEF